MKDKAVWWWREHPASLGHPGIEEETAHERGLTSLVEDKDGVVDGLGLQEGVHGPEEGGQVGRSLPVWHQHGHPGGGEAGGGGEGATRGKPARPCLVLLLQEEGLQEVGGVQVCGGGDHWGGAQAGCWGRLAATTLLLLHLVKLIWAILTSTRCVCTSYCAYICE